MHVTCNASIAGTATYISGTTNAKRNFWHSNKAGGISPVSYLPPSSFRNRHYETLAYLLGLFVFRNRCLRREPVFRPHIGFGCRQSRCRGPHSLSVHLFRQSGGLHRLLPDLRRAFRVGGADSVRRSGGRGAHRTRTAFFRLDRRPKRRPDRLRIRAAGADGPSGGIGVRIPRGAVQRPRGSGRNTAQTVASRISEFVARRRPPCSTRNTYRLLLPRRRAVVAGAAADPPEAGSMRYMPASIFCRICRRANRPGHTHISVQNSPTMRIFRCLRERLLPVNPYPR